MITNPISKSHFICALLGLCLLYLGVELFYNHYALLSVDEFWFAHRIYQYKNALPYRDFAPYKTVLGYYLLLLPMLIQQGTIATLVFTKNSIALLNTGMVFISALWLTRFFSRIGILTSVVFVLFSEIALSYSSQIRVDLLGYWLCYLALLLILEKRFLLAGLFIGLGFATTQKAIWYLAASDIALFTLWLMDLRQTRALSHLMVFNLAACAVMGVYLAFWSWIADWHTVLHSVFYEASVMYQLDWYNSTRLSFWKSILLYNFWIYFLWPVTLLSIFVTDAQDVHYRKRLFIVICSFVILLCLVPYQQVFPYYMQVTLPMLLLLYAAFFSWAIHLFTTKPTLCLVLPKIALWMWLIGYWLLSYWLIFDKLRMPLPAFYFLIALVTTSLIFYLTYTRNVSFFINDIFKLLTAIALTLGILYSGILFGIRLAAMTGAYQKANINTVYSLLNDGSDYVAGIELIYTKTQPIAGMRHLMGPAIDFLYTPTPKLKQVMLPSLYEDPNATIDSVIASLKNSNVKFYVNNYRMMALPKKIKQFLATQYQHWWGSIYLYSPQIAQGQQTFRLKFSGHYKIGSSPANAITINHRALHTGTTIYLTKGRYYSYAQETYRLTLIPETVPPSATPQFQQDTWMKMIF